MSFKSYFDFQLGNKKLSDFGGVLYNGDGYVKSSLLPNLNKQTEQLDMIDGAVYYGGNYEPRIITLHILIENENFDEAGFVNWIKSKEPQWFNYIGDDKKIKVVYENTLDIDIYNKKHGFIELTLVAHNPYWYLINDVVFTKTSPVVNTSYSFTNSGNTESFPLVKINCTTSQNVTFSLNSKRFKLTNIVGDIYIDFYTETVYKFVSGVKTNYLSSFECLDGKYKYEFGSLPVGNNTIKIISGTVNSITVNCNSRFI